MPNRTYTWVVGWEYARLPVWSFLVYFMSAAYNHDDIWSAQVSTECLHHYNCSGGWMLWWRGEGTWWGTQLADWLQSRSGSGEAWILDVGSPGQRGGLLAISGKRDFGDFEKCHNLSIFDIWYINHTFDTNRIDSLTSWHPPLHPLDKNPNFSQ